MGARAGNQNPDRSGSLFAFLRWKRSGRPFWCRLGFHNWSAYSWGQVGMDCRACGQEIDHA